MPRKARVEVSVAVEVIYHFQKDLLNGVLPPYTNGFYTNVANDLEGKWNRHDVYINLREDRRKLKNKVSKDWE